MPITLNENLPAYRILSDEGVMVMSPGRAATQDIRPLRIGLLNLMPKKIQTENQFARLIGATPLQINLSLIRMSDHESKNTAADHMESFYRPFSEVEASGERIRLADDAEPSSEVGSCDPGPDSELEDLVLEQDTRTSHEHSSSQR